MATKAMLLDKAISITIAYAGASAPKSPSDLADSLQETYDKLVELNVD